MEAEGKERSKEGGVLGVLKSLLFEEAPEEETPASAERPTLHGNTSGNLIAVKPAEALPSILQGKEGREREIASLPTVRTRAMPSPLPDYTETLPKTLSTLLRLVAALPANLTPEQLRPILRTTMEALELSPARVRSDLREGILAAERSITASKEAIAHAETETQQRIRKAQQQIEQAKRRCEETVALQREQITRCQRGQEALAQIAACLDGE